MKKILIITASLLIFSGCQQSPENSDHPLKSENNQTTVEKTVVDHGTPYSNGPTTSPNNMEPPTTPPPSNGEISQAQAVTTNENIKLTLPLKTE